MIGTIDICVNAANPNLPLKTIFSFKTSPSSLRIIDVPKKIGNWKIDKIYLNINYPNNEVISKDAKFIGGAWVTTFEGSETVGKVEKGYTVFADGIDENNNLIEGYILGKGDIVILNSDGKVEIDNETVNLHLVKDKPESPNTGDVILENGTYKVYADKKWNSIGDKAYFVNDSIYVDLEIETISFDDYYTKIDNEEEILSNRVYITSSDYTTGFWNRIIEVEDPINKNDAANKKYVDDLKSDTEEKLKLYTDRSIEEVNRDLTSNYLPNTTFIPTSTSELTNDANFQNSNQVSDIVENIAYNKGLTYNKNEIDSLISSSIRFKVKEISGDVSMQLEDLTLNYISAYNGQYILFPEKQAGYKRDFQLLLDNPTVSNVKWYIDEYNYSDTLIDPITEPVNSDAKYLYDIQDIDDSGSIFISRKSLVKETFDKGFEPICFIAEEANSTVCTTNDWPSNTPDAKLVYSMDGKTWNTYTKGTVLSAENIGDKIYFAAGPEGNETLGIPGRGDLGNHFKTTNGKFRVEGNLLSLIDFNYLLKESFVLKARTFTGLFTRTNITDASKLKLPLLSLPEGCYAKMFEDCTLLTNASFDLPATDSGNYGYNALFHGCKNLVSIPEIINLNVITPYTCQYMFDGCNNITKIPRIVATQISDYSFGAMFRACKKITETPVLSVYTNLSKGCFASMFSNCESLTTAPELPATTLVDSCYQNMFNGCTKLTQAPELPATTLAKNCYYYMFEGCTALTQAPALPATTLVESCYQYMFNGCTSLTQAPELPAMTLAKNCYGQMFYNCKSLTQAPELPATTLVDSCYQNMFNGCTKLTQAPELPATTLTSYCYNRMFLGCTKLNSINVNFSAWNPTNATTYWVSNVASSGTFTCPTDLPETYGTDYMPTGWTIERV